MTLRQSRIISGLIVFFCTAGLVVVCSRPAVAQATAELPSNLSAWKMFVDADIVVKAVIVGLAFASLVTWTIWLAKGIELVSASRKEREAIGRVASAGSIDQSVAALKQTKTVVRIMTEAASTELRQSEGLSAEGIKERVGVALSRVEVRAGRDMNRGTGLLATIGATAPFVGLFGTVWGIMNSFIGISQSKTTNLAVVAPGIAEALLATAIGLFAAIPAVIIYNVFSRGIAGYRSLLGDAAALILQHLSRDLESGKKRAERVGRG